MLGVLQTEETGAAQFNHFLRDRQYSGDGCIVGFLHLLPQTLKIQLGQDLVHHQQQLLQFELPSDFHRDGSSLEILLIGAQDQHQRIGNKNGEQRLLVQAWVGIKEEVIETKRFHQLAKAVGEQVDFVALPQDPRNLAGFDAGGDQVEPGSGWPR